MDEPVSALRHVLIWRRLTIIVDFRFDDKEGEERTRSEGGSRDRTSRGGEHPGYDRRVGQRDPEARPHT